MPAALLRNIHQLKAQPLNAVGDHALEQRIETTLAVEEPAAAT